MKTAIMIEASVIARATARLRIPYTNEQCIPLRNRVALLECRWNGEGVGGKQVVTTSKLYCELGGF